MAAPYQSLRDRQIGNCGLGYSRFSCECSPLSAAIQRILNLNQALSPASDSSHEPSQGNGVLPTSAPILGADGEPIWKVLVFDNLGRDVISSVLRVNDLRTWGVTIHLYVDAERKPREGSNLSHCARGLIARYQEYQHHAACNP